ncbi:MAG: hypothetical protein ABIR39_15045, partial [Nocardioides sp.]|uniref:hypothetical protein n=1 Tax=Nocardioides sp. TaxID=35761 RepID=UPI003267C424
MAGLSLCVGLVAVGLWFARDEPYRADLSKALPAPTALAGAAAASVQDLVQALEAGDPIAAAELASAGDTAAGELLAGAADNARVLRLRGITARYVDEVGAVAQDGSWSAAIDLSWAVEGFDREPAHAEVLVDFAPVDERVAITGLGGGDRISPLWLSGRLAVRRTPQALVMAGGPHAGRQARTYLQRVRRAIPVVRAVLTRWRPSVVVEVPSSSAALDDALDVEDGTYAGIAAVTAAADGVARPGAPVRVFVNPEVTGRLRGAGAQVVISHELVHVATDATSAVLDPWLL